MFAYENQPPVSATGLSFPPPPDLEKVSHAMEWTPNAPYDLRVIFGDERTIGLESYGKGFQVAIDFLLKDMVMSGSAIFEGAVGNPAYHNRDFLLSQAAQAFSPAVEAYYSGILQPDKLPPASYLGLQLVLGMQGPNIDIKGWSRSENVEQTFDDLHALLWFTYSFLYDGQKRTISKISTDRLSYTHLVDPNSAGNGGINVLVFKPDHDNTYWSTMTSVRQEQQAQMKLSEDESHWLLLNSVQPEGNRQMELTGHIQNLGQWCHHAARSIRTVATSSLTVSLDEDSYFNKQPWEEIHTFEDAVGTITNLLTAYFAQPKKTVELISSIGLDQFLPNWNQSVAENLATSLETYKETSPEAASYLSEAIAVRAEDTSSENASWQHMLAEFDQFLEDQALLVNSSEYAQQHLHSLKQLSTVVSLFSPVSSAQMLDLIPQPKAREKIEGTLSAGSARSHEEYQTNMQRTVKALEAIAERMEADSNQRAAEVRATLKQVTSYLG